jgi:ketosteroid isomerase-like protein
MTETTSGDRPTNQGAEARVRDTLERFRTGWERQDADQVLSTIRRRDDTVIYGTDLAEIWVGFDTLVEPFKAMTETIEAPVYAWGAGEPRLWVRGGVAWACGTLTVRLKDGGEVRTIPMRSTFVVENGEGGWKIAHAHFSVGQAEAVVAYGD